MDLRQGEKPRTSKRESLGSQERWVSLLLFVYWA
uniref:Uncharacterized protein n=1 Tax=Rhizophora mucronata TaxID=61149 RepID=A0A2P2Q0C1_RHIMU